MAKLKKIYLGIIIVFLYAPILVLIAQSFNASRYRGQWTGFTLQWYEKLFTSEDIIEAFLNTLTIGLTAAFFATLLGLITALAIRNFSKKSQLVFRGLANVPLLNADIVTGLSLMICFGAFGISLGYGSILVAHIAFCIPYVILSIMPRIKTASAGTYEAAQDLGASPFKAFMKVVLPELMPGIVAGFLLSFTMSLDDFVISYFVRGRGVDTLSTLIYTQVRRGIVPSMYALSTLIFVVVLVVLLVQNFAPGWIEKQAIKRKERKALKADPTNEIA